MKIPLFIFILCISVSAQAAFDETSLRYLAPWDLVYKLKTVFPNIGKPQDQCSHLKTISDDFGSNAPATGAAITNSPSALTVRWIEVCVCQLSERAISGDSTSWRSKTSADRQKILSEQLHRFLGEDEVVKSYGLIGDTASFIEAADARFRKNEKLSVDEVRRAWALELALRDEFLSY